MSLSDQHSEWTKTGIMDKPMDIQHCLVTVIFDIQYTIVYTWYDSSTTYLSYLPFHTSILLTSTSFFRVICYVVNNNDMPTQRYFETLDCLLAWEIRFME